MKSLDADKKANKTSEAAPVEETKPVEKIDFSNVKVEPLFEEMLILIHSQNQISEQLRLKNVLQFLRARNFYSSL